MKRQEGRPAVLAFLYVPCFSFFSEKGSDPDFAPLRTAHRSFRVPFFSWAVGF